MITPRAGVVIADRYEIERPLASGGMGSVWVAQHLQLGVAVAIKFMEPSLVASADARMRFEREARAAAQLDSSHVVAVRDYGVEDETPYLVMELLQGKDLAGRLRERGGRLPLAEVASIATQIAKALRKAHELGLVHRDLKPQNVFLAVKDDAEIVKLLDFGIAKAMTPGFAAEATRTGMLLGSVHYMSPEQARRSKTVDQRSDLWSLGVILFRALTGSLPFRGDEIGDVIVKICAEPIPAPSHIASDLPAELDGYFERALARDPAQRFSSAIEMAEALQAIADDAVRLVRRVDPPRPVAVVGIGKVPEGPVPTEQLVVPAKDAITQQWLPVVPMVEADVVSASSGPISNPIASTLSPTQTTKNAFLRGPRRSMAWVAIGAGSLVVTFFLYFVGRTVPLDESTMPGAMVSVTGSQEEIPSAQSSPAPPIEPEDAGVVEDASVALAADSPAESAPPLLLPPPPPPPAAPKPPGTAKKTGPASVAAPTVVPSANPAPSGKPKEKRLDLP